jgi:tetratricopeptide (TPR) repeat protein
MASRLGGNQEQRYFALLLQKDPGRLVKIARFSPEGNATAATQYAVAHGNSNLAQAAVAARGESQPPVWTKSYSAITGLYFADRSSGIKASFVDALGDATIGERVGKPVDRTQQLAGNVWFYYGSRYGEWTGMAKAGDPENFLPAILEQSPSSASGYISVAEYYADAGKLDQAIQDYSHTLELAPVRADIHDRMALIYWRQKKHDEAVAEWKQALEMLDVQVNQRAVPPSFWSNLSYTLNHIGNRKLLPELRPQADIVLRDYVRHNGTYQSNQILRAAFLATGDPQAGVTWLLDLASLAPDQISLLQQLVGSSWIPASARDPLYQQVLGRLQDSLRTREGLSREYMEQDFRSWQLKYARYLVDLKQSDRAAVVLQSLKSEQPSADELELRFRLAIERNEFDSILNQYRAEPEKAPPAEVLRAAARALQTAGQRPAARKIFEYVFSQEIVNHQLSSSNMLGLAEIRLSDGDISGGMEILKRLTLVVGRPFENQQAAATLLIRTGHHVEAVEFLTQQVKAVPWDTNARLRLAQEQIAAGKDASTAREDATAVASNPQAAYSDRMEAAKLLAGAVTKPLGSAELDMVSKGDWASADASDKPYFYIGRVRASEKATTADIRERLLRNALNDTPERDAARLPLFFTFANAGKDQLAISAIQPVLNTGFLHARYRRASEAMPDEQEETDSQEPDQLPQEEGAETPIRPDNQLEKIPASQRVALAIAVGKSYQKLDQLQQALSYFELASSFDKTNVARTEIDQNIRNVRAAIRRNAGNEQRMPVIHNELEQEHVVRPRLVAAVPKPPVPVRNTKGGRAQ